MLITDTLCILREFVSKRVLAALFIIHCSLFTSPVRAQLTLERVIRLAQDSTLAAYESRYENEYHRLKYGEFMALRKPQIDLRVAPNYYKYISNLKSDYVDVDNYHNLSAAASVTLSQKMLDWGGEAYVGAKAVWTEYLSSNKSFARQFVAAPLLVGYRQTLLGYNPYHWEKTVEDQRLKAARMKHEFDMNNIAEEAVKRYFRLVYTQGELEMYRRNVQVADTLYAIAREKASIAMVTAAELRTLELDRVNAVNLLAMARTAEEVARTSLASYLRIDSDSLGTQTPSSATLGTQMSPSAPGAQTSSSATPGAQTSSSALPLFFIIPPVPAPPTLSVAEAVAMALANSPVIHQKIAELTDSRHQEQKAQKEKGLNVSLDVNVGMQQVDQKLGEAFRDQRLHALGAVTFTIPLMDHGAAKNRHAAALARVAQEENSLAEAERSIREDVAKTLQDVNTFHLLLKSTREATVTADEVYELTADNYANGLCDINTYALAERRRADAYERYLVSLEKYWTNYYHLKTLIGN